MSQNKKSPGKSTGRKVVPANNRLPLPVIVVSAIAVVLVLIIVLATQGNKVLADQDLVIKTGDITETAKFYPIDIQGTRLEVLAVKAPDGTIRTAFNTCQVCYASGRGYYKQSGDVLICQNCGNRFSMNLVEIEAGGCNPWPIFDENKIVTDESITITYDFLKESRGIFLNWKASY